MNDQPSPAAEGSTDEPVRAQPTTDRRRVLRAVGVGGAVLFAGCLSLDDPDVATYVVVFIDDDERVEVEIAGDEDLLSAALDAGIDVPYSCLVGRCGQCTARYDGDANEVVTHDGNQYLTDEQIADGWVLTCVAFAEADHELEVAHPDDG